jgi:hypothetical protein
MLTVRDNTQGNVQTANLTGAGVDFSLTTSSGSATVKSGFTATYLLTVAPAGGSFPNAVKLTCSGFPTLTTCGVVPSSVTPGGGFVTATLTVTTTAPVARALPLENRTFYAWMQLPGIGLIGMILARYKGKSNKWRLSALLGTIMASTMLMSACAGGTGIAHQPQPGTTPGTYAITVTGTAGPLQHSLPLTLRVQ